MGCYLSEKCFPDNVYKTLERKICVMEIYNPIKRTYEYYPTEYVHKKWWVLDDISGVLMYPLSISDMLYAINKGGSYYNHNTKRSRLSALRKVVKVCNKLTDLCKKYDKKLEDCNTKANNLGVTNFKDIVSDTDITSTDNKEVAIMVNEIQEMKNNIKETEIECISTINQIKP